jgi:hypothetical protein
MARWQWLEGHLHRLGDHLNPILVKESRQALKSRQFLFTFFTLLIASWFTSIMGLAYLGVETELRSDGPVLFVWYIAALAAALLLAVPMFAFHALASEREDRTYELLQITQLSAVKIVGGKLAIAVLQMLIYLSALAPCLAFTYLLRGIDLPTILYYLFALCVLSVCGSVMGLMFGSLSERGIRQRSLQGVFVLGLGIFMVSVISGVVSMANFSLPWDSRDFWIINVGLFLAVTTTAILFFLATAANLNFPSSNRSTPQRLAMVGQFVVCAGWFGWLGSYENVNQDAAGPLMVLGAIYWYIMGIFLTGESPVLSPRVKRGLPNSTLGRIFFTWLHPGPVTGYVFCITGMVATIAMAVLLIVLSGKPLTSGNSFRLLELAAVFVSYLIIYLAAGKALLSIMRLSQQPSPVQRVIIHLAIVIAATAFPLLIDWTRDNTMGRYSLMEASNPFWTLQQLNAPTGADDSVVLLSVVALVVLLVQLRSISRELDYVRIRTPQRVQEEEAALAPHVERRPTSPWDE